MKGAATEPAMHAPYAETGLPGRRDVAIEPEAVRRIVLGLDLPQPCIIGGTVRRPRPFLTAIAIPQEIQEHPLRAERRE